MKRRWFRISAAVLFSAAMVVRADTFTQRSSGSVYHGYATQTAANGKVVVQTEKDGPMELNLAEFDIIPNAKGRNNTIAVIPVKGVISFELLTAAFEKAVVEESNKGPLFILIEIDSPGGRIDLARQMAAAIINTRNCRTVAFVHGGSVGGA